VLHGGRGDGLYVGQDDLRHSGVRLGHVRGVYLFRVIELPFALELFEEQRDAALALELLDAGGWSEWAERGVLGDFLDEEGRLGVAGWLGQGDDGGLQAVEQQAGAARVEVVGGDALQDKSDSVQDAAAVGELVGAGELKGAEAGLAGGGVLDGAAGGVVLVAEILPAQAGRGAAVAVHIDMAAAETLAGVGSRSVVGLAHLGFLHSCGARTLPPGF
jgi:hypothetical protein